MEVDCRWGVGSVVWTDGTVQMYSIVRYRDACDIFSVLLYIPSIEDMISIKK